MFDNSLHENVVFGCFFVSFCRPTHIKPFRPDCETHFKSTQGENLTESWYDWVWFIGYSPHGPVHSWVGGVGGECDTWSELVNKTDGSVTETQVRELKHASFNILKNSYRFNVFDMPSVCTADTPQEECIWTCKDSAYDENSDLAGYISTYSSVNTSDLKVLGHVVHALCTTPFYPGDHLESASPVEASFWPIHPTIDRLLQYKELVKPFNDTTWEDYNNSASRYNCLSYTRSNCDGHHAYDLTFWESVTYNESDGTYTRSYKSNQEVRDALRPGSGYQMSYIYDNFDW